MKITAKDIAREAGVSEATVSIILNNKAGHYRISEKTRQKVLEIAERYEFTCNPIAVSLATRKTHKMCIRDRLNSLKVKKTFSTCIFPEAMLY